MGRTWKTGLAVRLLVALVFAGATGAISPLIAAPLLVGVLTIGFVVWYRRLGDEDERGAA